MKTPAQRPDIKAYIHALADLVLGERADKHLLRTGLVTTLTVAVRDFDLCYPAAFAEQRVKDFAICQQYQAARQKAAEVSS